VDCSAFCAQKAWNQVSGQAQATFLGNQYGMALNGRDTVPVAQIYQQIADTQNRRMARDAAPTNLYPGC
jgi:hypothetical protein